MARGWPSGSVESTGRDAAVEYLGDIGAMLVVEMDKTGIMMFEVR